MNRTRLLTVAAAQATALALAAAPAAVAQTIGYAGADQPGDSQSYCAAGQPCTYVSDGGAQWTPPAGASIDSFTVHHGAVTGSQTATLDLVRYDGANWVVDSASQPGAESGGGQLSAGAGSDTFTLSAPLQVQQGEALAVTVTPADPGAAAANLLVSQSGAGGESRGCASAAAPGQALSCDSTPAMYDWVLALSADAVGAPSPGSSGSSGSGSSGSGGSTTIQPVSSTPITPYRAAQIAFYRATIIKRLPPAPPIAKLPSRGWAISAPAVCNALCVYAGTIIANNVGVWYYDGAADVATAARSLVLGSVRVSGKGRLRPRIVIKRSLRRKLLRARRAIRVVVLEKVVDRRYGFVKTRRQTLVLRP